MLEKRSLDIGAATSLAKRAKLEEQPATGPRKISLDSIKENLARKKRELAEIQQKILKKKENSQPSFAANSVEVSNDASKVSVFQAAAQAAARLGTQVGVVTQESQPNQKPIPLRVDDKGREIDEKGNLIEAKKIGLQVQPQTVRAEQFIDPNIISKSSRRKAKQQLEFVVEGRLHREAQIFKLKQKYGEHHWKHHFFRLRRKEEQERQRAVEVAEAEKMDEDEEDEVLKPQSVPDIEWWDGKLLPPGLEAYEQSGDDGKFKFKQNMITNLVEHPVPIDPPIDDEPPPVQPLKLTPKEIKKLRHQRRIEREKQRQEMIQRGLIEPPKPKVKLTNLFRVLGEQSTADPTAIEAEVRKQMAERQQAHNDRNIARKLTPMEKKEKKLKKMFNLEQQEVQVAVFRVDYIPGGQNRTIVGKNAGYNEFTGAQIIVEGSMSVVIVEGEFKGIERFKKLMINRINWQAGLEENEEWQDRKNRCFMVWDGVVQERSFRVFRTEVLRTEGAAKKLLKDSHVEHYWDLAKNFVPPDQ